MVKIYKFEGHSNYRKYQPEIRELVLSASNDSELSFILPSMKLSAMPPGMPEPGIAMPRFA